jgi:ankyrin repeat protein
MDEQEENMKELALKTFIWVLYAKRPLRTAELRHALATEGPLRSQQDLELDSIDVILEACANLLIEERDIVRPIHFSVQEFLTNPPNSALQGLFIENIQASEFVHQKLALTCIFYLQLDVLHQGPCQDPFDLLGRFARNPFLWHSARFFDYYIRALKHLPDEVLQPLEALIHNDGLFLAAVLQTRKIHNVQNYFSVCHDFSQITYPVDVSMILYSTQLYDIPHFNAQLVNDQVPPYALHNAAASGSLPAVIRLIEAGCSIEEEDEGGKTPLYIAALGGHMLIVKQLLERTDDANAQGGPYGPYDNALQAASYGGNVAIVQLLLSKGADINAWGGIYGNALQAALYEENMAIVQLLLDKGADTNAQGGDYGNALEAASNIGNVAIVQLLLSKGANVNAQGGLYGNALQAASDRGYEAIVTLLLDKGADVNAVDITTVHSKQLQLKVTR